MALTILTLLDAAALVPDIGVGGVTPRAPLVLVGVSAVVLLQPVAGGWQEPAGSRVGRRAARSPLPRGGRSHNAVPPLISATARILSPLPPRCSQPIPCCPQLPKPTGGCHRAARDMGAPVVVGRRGSPVLAAQPLLCGGPCAAVAGAIAHDAVPQVVWTEPGTVSEPWGRARARGQRRVLHWVACARPTVSPCPPTAPAHLSSGTGHSGCFSAAGHGASAGSRAAAGTAGSAGHGGTPWEAQWEPGKAPCKARTHGRTQGHPSARSDPAVTVSCSPARPAAALRPAHRQSRLVAQRWAHCSAETRSAEPRSGGGGSADAASSLVARRRWKSLRGER